MVGTALASTLNVFFDNHTQERCLLMNETIGDPRQPEDGDDWVLQLLVQLRNDGFSFQVVQSGYAALGYGCPIFARKFAKQTVRQTLKTALSCAGAGLGHWC